MGGRIQESVMGGRMDILRHSYNPRFASGLWIYESGVRVKSC